MTKIETKNKKKGSKEAEEFKTHGGKEDDKDRQYVREGNSKNNKRQG